MGLNDMSKDILHLSQERFDALLGIEMRARAFVEGVTQLRGVGMEDSDHLKALRESLKPIEPEYVPLVSREELQKIWNRYPGGVMTSHIYDMRTAIVLALRKMGDEKEREGMELTSVMLRNKALKEEKYAEAEAKHND